MRLYFFAIGGTGARVLKSLTMLLAAGVDTGPVTEIVPILVDPHQANKDLKRTIDLLKYYQEIRASLNEPKTFFKTKISTLDSVVKKSNSVSTSFAFSLQRVKDDAFKEYIGRDSMSQPNRLLADLLFSGTVADKNGNEIPLMDTKMEVGFLGNPNIGSVVLNQFADSQEFKSFQSCFNDNDRVFLTGSIFGGTGAAGLPLILKNLRQAEGDNSDFLKNAPIGALVVMPYFNLQQSATSSIRRADWIAKTKSALSYYAQNVTGERSGLNAMYYISDPNPGMAYDNDPGFGGQQNDAHVVEMAGALALVDFCRDQTLKSKEGKAEDPQYREFGIKKDEKKLRITDMDDKSNEVIAYHLTRFAMQARYSREHFKHFPLNKADYLSRQEPQLDQAFSGSPFFRSYLSEFNTAFVQWLKEMGDNDRAFEPFNLDAKIDSLIQGMKAKGGLMVRGLSWETYDNTLSDVEKKTAKYPSAPEKYLDLHFQATTALIAKYFPELEHYKS